MKKAIILLTSILAGAEILALTPKQYVEKNYKENGILFTEDVDDWLDQASVGERSPIIFFNSTTEDIEFELHELKTSFNQVKKDVIRKIKGREIVKIKAGEYLIPAITFEDVEHIVFVFKTPNMYDVLGYSDNSMTEQYAHGSFYGFANKGVGFIGGDSETRTVYSIVFEIIKKE